MDVLIPYLVGGIVAIAFAGLFYTYAVSTRRTVQCRSCGETVRMEHDRIDHCPSCGAPLP